KNEENQLSPSPGNPGQLGRRGANRPKSLQVVHTTVGTSRRAGREKVNRPKEGIKFPKSCFAESGTFGKKVRERCGSASLAQVSPFRAVRRNFSQAVRDSWDKSTRRTRTGRFGRNRELSFGTLGPK
ncbi:hypothetical protein KI387_017062, partial [Taxus chinensis]